MENKHLEAYSFLSNMLKERKEKVNSLKYLRLIVDERLKSDNTDTTIPVPVLRKELYAKVIKKKTDDIDEKLAQKIKREDLQVKLDEIIQSYDVSRRFFEELGVTPNIGETSSDKNEAKQFWIELIEITDTLVVKTDLYVDDSYNRRTNSEIFTDQPINSPTQAIVRENRTESAKASELVIEYQCTSLKDVKGSYFSKLFFKDNELKLKTVKGISFMLLLFFSFSLNILFAIASIWLFIAILKSDSINLFFMNVLLMIGFVAYAYFTYRFVYKPLHSLPRNRIIKAPDFLISANQFNAELELFRPTDFNIARITEYISSCPICDSKIELDYGKPDQNHYMVGRCKGAPHAHVYSFDRMTLKGFFLGHEGYLKSRSR